MMDAAGHAQRASELVEGVERRLKAIEDLTPDQHLQMVAGGGFKQHNGEIETSLSLARIHALTSLAMQGVAAGALDATGDHASDATAVRDALTIPSTLMIRLYREAERLGLTFEEFVAGILADRA